MNPVVAFNLFNGLKVEEKFNSCIAYSILFFTTYNIIVDYSLIYNNKSHKNNNMYNHHIKYV